MASEKLEHIIPMAKDVVIGGKTYRITKMALGQYAKVLLIFKKLPGSVLKEFQNLDTSDEDSLIATLFGTIADTWGQLIEIISLGSGIGKDVIENDPAIGLDGGVELFLAIWEVNNLATVVTSVKNAMTRQSVR